MPREYLRDGDVGFLGLNSRDNAATIPQGYVSKSVNMRLDRGVATTRKGLKKFSEAELYGPTKKVVGCGSYLSQTGQEVFILLLHDSSANVTKLYTFNPETGVFSPSITLTTPIPSDEGVEIIQAIDKVFISRGHNARPLIWDLSTTPTEIPANQEFPKCSGMMFYQNRIIAIGRHHDDPDTRRSRDSVSVSHFLQYDKWSATDVFTINQGGNDEVVSIVPWTMNEFLVLCRNSTFYLNVGSNRYTAGAALSADSRLESLSVDIGCVAKRSAVQVGGGVLFLSDNGVYLLQPTQSGVPDGVKLLSLSDPISAPIDDYIQKINRAAAGGSVGAYWNNRYYLAVPLGESTKNNAVLVYNFILKAWESVDVYPEGVDIFAYLVGKRGSQRRLFIVDSNEGILLTEEGSSQELGGADGSPILNVTPSAGPYAGLTGAYLPFNLLQAGYNGMPVEGELVTRMFTATDGRLKRFSSIETDVDCPAGSILTTYAISINPDSETKIDEFISIDSEDAVRKNPVRKIAYGLQVKFVTSNLQPTIRSNFTKFTVNGKNNINKS